MISLFYIQNVLKIHENQNNTDIVYEGPLKFYVFNFYNLKSNKYNKSTIKIEYFKV